MDRIQSAFLTKFCVNRISLGQGNLDKDTLSSSTAAKCWQQCIKRLILVFAYF